MKFSPKEIISGQEYSGLKVIDNFSFDLKLCKTWYLVTPPLSHHWYYCDTWVERHDHHCQWIGTWVGRRNFRSFLGFITSLNTLYFSIFASHLVLISIREVRTISNVFLYFFMVITFILWVINTAYLIFLFMLVGKGLTSNQYLTKSYKEFKKNPYDLGWKNNFKRAFNCKEYNSRIRTTFTNKEILQEYGELVKRIVSPSESEQDLRNEWYKENNSEILEHQDINDTMVNHSKTQNKIENDRSRQIYNLKSQKLKLNDTNFETVGASRDQLFSLGNPSVLLTSL